MLWYLWSVSFLSVPKTLRGHWYCCTTHSVVNLNILVKDTKHQDTCKKCQKFNLLVCLREKYSTCDSSGKENKWFVSHDCSAKVTAQGQGQSLLRFHIPHSHYVLLSVHTWESEGILSGDTNKFHFSSTLMPMESMVSVTAHGSCQYGVHTCCTLFWDQDLSNSVFMP